MEDWHYTGLNELYQEASEPLTHENETISTSFMIDNFGLVYFAKQYKMEQNKIALQITSFLILQNSVCKIIVLLVSQITYYLVSQNMVFLVSQITVFSFPKLQLCLFCTIQFSHHI